MNGPEQLAPRHRIAARGSDRVEMAAESMSAYLATARTVRMRDKLRAMTSR
jgi:hypothetical protein